MAVGALWMQPPPLNLRPLLTLPPGVSRMSMYMLRMSVIGAFLMHVGHTMCLVSYITALGVV